MNQSSRARRLRPGSKPSSALTAPRPMCYRCMRPRSVCHCSTIPKIRNKTEIVIAQHIAERSHAFNTARMVAQSLDNATIFSDYPENMNRYSSRIDDTTALLYPGPEAVDIQSLAPSERPQKILLLDGTWNHAKQLYRHWPRLKNLRHLKITPAQPGNYRIRLEPNDFSLSTVEAVVAVLQCWEPKTPGCEELLRAFETMVDRQLAHPSATYNGISSRRKPTRNIPASICHADARLVFAYGEAEPILRGSPKKSNRTPVYWVASKLVGREIFKAAIQSNRPLDKQLLSYFQLHESDFNGSVSAEQFRKQWARFCCDDETLVVYNQNTIRLLNSLGVYPTNYISMKSVNFSPGQKHVSLADYFEANSIQRIPSEFAGRAGERLANLITLISHLRSDKPFPAVC